MALDYNQKKQVNKNRPRKRPVKLLLILIIGSIISLYGLGIATGWLVFRYLPQKTTLAPSGSAKPEVSAQSPPAPAPTAAKNGASTQNKDPDLTFYYTLPKGDKGVIGSGINNLPPQPASKIAPTIVDNSGQQQQRSAEKKETSAAGGTTSNKKTYTVQVAAYDEKADAQGLQAKLQKIGISSRVEEYSVPGKGTWYRVRSGSKLDKVDADRIAAKLGNNAILVAE